jgi:hypothetical protein
MWLDEQYLLIEARYMTLPQVDLRDVSLPVNDISDPFSRSFPSIAS